MIVVSDYCGFRIEANAAAVDGRWNAEVRTRRLFSEEKPHIEHVTCQSSPLSTRSEPAAKEGA